VRIDRRNFALGIGSSSLLALDARTTAYAQAADAAASTITDGAGRRVVVPATVQRVFPAGPPAAIMLYTLAPELLLGWPRANRAEECAFMLPDICRRPELGRLTGRGNTANLEVVTQLAPDLILDVGSVRETFVSLADRVQQQTGVPYALLDGRLAETENAYRLLGKLVRRETEAEEFARYVANTIATIRSRIAAVPESARPRVYYARGPRGLETGLAGSINVETIEFLGAVNVASGLRGGLATVSLEQVLAWNPDVIVTIDQDFAAAVRTDADWRSIAAVRTGRMHLSPKLPFGWVDFPPSVNRVIGLWWLAKMLYPEIFPEDLRPLARDFYARFYHVTPSESDIERVLAGRN
jgi:iron complex transport system substrate-binding protein